VLVVLGRAVAVAPGGAVAADRSSSMPPTRASRRATDAIIRWIALTSVVISAFVAAGALPSGMRLVAGCRPAVAGVAAVVASVVVAGVG